MYRSKKYLKFIRSQPSCAPVNYVVDQTGDIVPAHQRGIMPCGVGIKPSDTATLPLYFSEHEFEHRDSFALWGNTNRSRLCVEHICRYLDQNHNIDGWRKVLELITDYMEENKL